VLACTGVFATYWKWEVEAKKDSIVAIRRLQAFRQNMVLSIDNVNEGRYWVYLTSTFTHNRGSHLMLNMVSLLSASWIIVPIFGTSTLAVLWVGAGVVKAVAQERLWRQETPPLDQWAVGASGSIFGIYTALSCVMPCRSVDFFWIPIPMWSSIAGAAVFSIAAINQGWLPFIGHADHLEGMAFRLIWGLAVLRRRVFRKFAVAPRTPNIRPRF